MPLAEKAIEQVYGGKYDVKFLVHEVRSQGRRFLEQAAIVFYDNLPRNLPGDDLYTRLFELARPMGLDVWDAKGKMVAAEEVPGRYRDFLQRVVSRGIKHRDGSALTQDELISIVDNTAYVGDWSRATAF
jgi:hypothetical protein